MDDDGKGRSGLFNKKTLANLAVVAAGVLLYFALQNIDSLFGAAGRLLSIMSPFIFGAIIAFLLDIPTRYFERRLYAKFKARRALAIVTSYAFALLSLFCLFWLVVPQLIDSTRSLVGNVHMYVENLNDLVDWIGRQFNLEPESLDQFILSYEDLVNQFLLLFRDLLPGLIDISMRIGTGIVTFLTALIASIYMLAGKERLQRQCRRVLYAFVPRRGADTAVRVMKMSSDVFAGFISGKILDSAIIGSFCFLGMSLMDAFLAEMPFMPLISVVIGVTNIIPFFGPFIGAIPSAMILLMVNPMSALWFVLFIVVLQQFDGNILGPKILGDSTGLPALWVLAAIIVGGGLFGFIGMVAGVPAVAVLHTLISEAIRARLKKQGAQSGDGRPGDGGDDGGGGGSGGGDGGPGDGGDDGGGGLGGSGGSGGGDGGPAGDGSGSDGDGDCADADGGSGGGSAGAKRRRSDHPRSSSIARNRQA